MSKLLEASPRQTRQMVAEAREGHAKSVIQYRNELADRLIEKWNRTQEGHKLERLKAFSRPRARATALAMEMELAYLKKKLKESGTQISSSIQFTPENVLRIVRIGVANSNRADIATEWPLTSTNDALYFIDKVYGTSQRGATAGSRIYDSGLNTYASEINDTAATTNAGVGNGIITTFTGTATTTPLIPYKVTVVVANQTVANDDGSGAFSGSTTLTGTATGTVDYTTGALSVTFTTAPASGAAVVFEYFWNSEDSDNFDEWGDIQLTTRKLNWRPRPFPLTYSYSKMMEITLGTTGFGDTEEMLVRAVGDEHAKRRDFLAFRDFKRLANSNALNTFNADFAAEGEDNDTNHAQRIGTKIKLISTQIYNDLKRGGINKIFAEGNAVAYFMKHKTWKDDDSQPRVTGSFLAGKLGNIEVYQTPSDSQTVESSTASNGGVNGQAVLLFKNPEEDGEPCIAYGVLTEIAAALDYPNLYRQGSLATIEDKIVVQSKYARRLDINNILD